MVPLVLFTLPLLFIATGLVIALPLLFIATALVILRRAFHARGRRHRVQMLARLPATDAQSLLRASSEEGVSTRETKCSIIAGFLHPYCNAGGGGERVLFSAISYLQRNDPHVLSIVYTGDVDAATGLPVPKSQILKRCKERFGIKLDETRVEFIHLKWRWLIEDATWKHFTLLGQGIGAALLVVEALWRLVPDVLLDTHGLAFSYPVARFLTYGMSTQSRSTSSTPRSLMPITAYIHYPTISASMLTRVSNREATYANSAAVSSSSWRSSAKLIYYRIFTFAYTSAIQVIPPKLIVVNSSWTRAHVEALLDIRRGVTAFPGVLSAALDLVLMVMGRSVPIPKRINQPPSESAPGEHFPANTPPSEYATATTGTGSRREETGVRRIYPPCDVEPLRGFPLEGRQKVIFSCAQFRPEKDHAKQIQAFAMLFKKHPEFFTPTKRTTSAVTKDDDDPMKNSTDGTTVGIGAEVGTADPKTIEQSGWLHVDTSRSSSPAKRTHRSTTPQETAAAQSSNKEETLKLVLLGSARHHEDLARVEELRALARELGVEAHVEFRLNAPYRELLHWLSVSSIGISTMVEEHFGIGVVEFMGAGLIPVVHASGGPIMDIVIPIGGKPTGYLATSAEEFADQLYTALRMDKKDELEMRARAREGSERFSTAAFEQGFGALWKDIKKTL